MRIALRPCQSKNEKKTERKTFPRGVKKGTLCRENDYWWKECLLKRSGIRDRVSEKNSLDLRYAKVLLAAEMLY